MRRLLKTIPKIEKAVENIPVSSGDSGDRLSGRQVKGPFDSPTNDRLEL